MCGIVGFLAQPVLPEAGAANPAREAMLRRMTAAVAHRGPDGEGYFIERGTSQLYFGHRRLGILAPGPVGAQPISDLSRRYTMVFNGAIYNYVELARELSVSGAAAGCDTAVLLAAWAAWGPACLGKLNGMFAFALWDAQERALYLCRDRFGEKPLHYVLPPRSEIRLLFASEAKALFASGLLHPRVDRGQLVEFLAAHDVDHRGNVDGTTLFAGVLQLPAGSYLRLDIDTAQPQPRRYYALSPSTVRRPLTAGLIEEAQALLRDSVSMRLRSDVPIGGSLSGGLDSSLITALVMGLGDEGYRLFSCQFPDAKVAGDERVWADRVASSLGRRDLVRVSPSAAEFAADLEAVLFHQEAPFADASISAHFALMRSVREQGVKVLLSGQGGDEVFAGYPSYMYALLGQLGRAGEVGALWPEARARSQRSGEPLSRLFLGAAYHALPSSLHQQIYRRRRRGHYPLSIDGERLLLRAPPRFSNDLPPLCAPPAAAWGAFDRYLLDCMSRWALPHILRHDDRNSMAFGVESRAPYLDHRLLELLLTVEPVARIGDGYTKRLLRETARGLLPEDVRLRVDKRGFFAPQRDWLRASEDLVRSACHRLPDELAELTHVRSLQASLDGFYKDRRANLEETVFSALIGSLFFQRVMPRFANLGI